MDNMSIPGILGLVLKCSSFLSRKVCQQIKRSYFSNADIFAEPIMADCMEAAMTWYPKYPSCLVVMLIQ